MTEQTMTSGGLVDGGDEWRPTVQDAGPEVLSWLRRMRDERPVSRGRWGIFEVFRYDDVRQVLSDHATFSSDTSRLSPDAVQFSRGSLMLTDPPEHRKLRGLVSQAFTPKMVARLEPRILELTTQLLDDIDGDEFDLVERFAHPLPLMVIAELLGVPISDRGLFRGWADRLVGLRVTDPTTEAADMGMVVGTAMSEMGAYLLDHVRDRRSHARDDMLSDLVAAEVDGHRLDDQEIVNSSCLLLLAGQITSTMALGNAILCLRDNPAAEAELRANPDLLPSAFEEVLRHRPPLTQAARISTVDVEVGGQVIPANSMIISWMLSANYDERQFPDPERFDIHRQPNRQYAFGHGIHFCLGAQLARVEGVLALDLLFRRFAEITVRTDDPLSFYEDPMCGVKALPVAVRRA